MEDAAEIGRRKKVICAAHGFEGLFPLDKEISRVGVRPAELAHAIYEANVGLMLKADLLIANVTPFRGVSMDAGTAFEIGFCTARNLPVFAYANVTTLLANRILAKEGRQDSDNRTLTDSDGMEIENYGFFENLMVEVPARISGGGVIVGEVPPREFFRSLANFERAVLRASEMLGVTAGTP